MIRIALAGVCAAAMFTASAFSQDEAGEPLTVIHAGTLMAAPGEDQPQTGMSILVRGDRIEAIESGYVTPDGAEIIDLSDDYVMPGFIDAHVHITNEQGPGLSARSPRASPIAPLTACSTPDAPCRPASPPFRMWAETSKRCAPCATGSRRAISWARAFASPAAR